MTAKPGQQGLTIRWVSGWTRRRFTNTKAPFIYKISSNDACWCGVNHDTEKADKEAVKRSLADLRAYLAQVTEDGDVELLSCWVGDEEKDPTSRQIVTPDYFAGDSFAFKPALNHDERQLLKVTKG